MEPLGTARVLAGMAPSALSPKALEEALSGFKGCLSMGDSTRSLSSWEEVRHDCTSRGSALRLGHHLPPARGALETAHRFTETRGPPTSPGLPPHILCCCRPASREAVGGCWGVPSAGPWSRG